MKVLHISPTYFDEGSIIGGGERYPSELALWMSKIVDTTLVSFSSKRKTYYQDKLKIEIYPAKYLLQNSKLNSLNLGYIKQIVGSDIVHIHHLNSLASAVGAFTADILNKPVYVTDYGGGSGLGWKLNQLLSVSKRYKNAIAYSAFGMNQLPSELKSKAVLIKGGIDTDRFCLNNSVQKEKTILYVGRILPHKGINYLIEGFRLLNKPKYKLKIVGRAYSDRYYDDLQKLAEGWPIEFIHDVDDQRLLKEYQAASVTVLPSVHTTCYGDYSPVPELMGFTLLESQACGTPVICTDAGAMHEFLDNGKTGYAVKQNSGEAIAVALSELINLSFTNPEELQANCQKWVHFLNWQTVVEQHLDIYQSIH